MSATAGDVGGGLGGSSGSGSSSSSGFDTGNNSFQLSGGGFGSQLGGGSSGSQSSGGGGGGGSSQQTMFTSIAPQSIQEMYGAQMGALNAATNTINQYGAPTVAAGNVMSLPSFDPNSLNSPSIVGNTPNLTASVNPYYSGAQYYQGQAATGVGAAMAGPSNAINNVINQYANNPNINPNANQTLTNLNNAYTNAIGQYNQTTGGTNLNGPTSGDIGGAYQGLNANNTSMYNTAQQQFNPFIQLGQGSANQLGNLTGSNGTGAQQTAVNNMINNPMLSGVINQGAQAIGSLGSATGGLQSGNLMRELQQFGQQTSGNFINQQEQQLLNQASLGNSAAGQLAGSVGQQAGVNSSNLAQQTALQQARTGQEQTQGLNQAGLITGQNAAYNAQQNAQTNQQLQYGQNQNTALGLGATQAQNLSSDIMGIANTQSNISMAQQAAQNQALQQQFTNQDQLANQQYQSQYQQQYAQQASQIAANQSYLQNMVNNELAKGNAGSAKYQAEGQTINTMNS